MGEWRGLHIVCLEFPSNLTYFWIVGRSLSNWREFIETTQKAPSWLLHLNQGPLYCAAIVLTTTPLHLCRILNTVILYLLMVLSVSWSNIANFIFRLVVQSLGSSVCMLKKLVPSSSWRRSVIIRLKENWCRKKCLRWVRCVMEELSHFYSSSEKTGFLENALAGAWTIFLQSFKVFLSTTLASFLGQFNPVLYLSIFRGMFFVW